MTMPAGGQRSANSGTVAVECARCGAGIDIAGDSTGVVCMSCHTAMDCCRCEYCGAGTLIPVTAMVKSVMCPHCGETPTLGTWRSQRVVARAVGSALVIDGGGADIDRRRLTGTVLSATGMAWLVGGATCSLVFGPDRVQALTDASIGAREIGSIDYSGVDAIDWSADGPIVETLATVVHLRAGDREIYLRTDTFGLAAFDQLLQPVRIRINAARRRARPVTPPTPPQPPQWAPPPRPRDAAPATIPTWPVPASPANSSSSNVKLWAILAGVAAVMIAIVLTVSVVNHGPRSTPASPATSYSDGSEYPSASAMETPPGGRENRQGTIPPPPVTAPDAYQQYCPDGFNLPNRTGFGTHAYRGSVETSCQFASNVLRAYWDQYSNATAQPRSVIAPGTVRCSTTGGQCAGDDFVMQCAVEAPNDYIVCRGGRNAVVFLF